MTYPQQAPALFKAGYSPIPLPPGKKTPPPDGWSGADGAWVSWADVQAWIDDKRRADANTAARLPPTVVGIDVDAYDGKPGAQTLAELTAAHGQAPATCRVTSRTDDVSGIRLYQLPDGFDESRLNGGLPGIEILRFGHRYVTAPGSIHPSGAVYRVYDEWSGQELDTLPDVGTLPVLPMPWCQAFTKGTAAGKPAAQHRSITAGQPCQAVAAALAGAFVDLGSGRSRHDATRDGVARLMRLGDQGHEGVRRAMNELRKEFMADVTTTGAETRSSRAAANEYSRMVRGMVDLLNATPTPDRDRRCCGSLAVLGQADEPAGRMVRLTTLADIELKTPRWLWRHRFPLGALSLLAGREGLGKSTVGYWLAAEVTRGRLDGEHRGQPRAVIVAATEDSWSHVIGPRLIAAGADPRLVHRVDVTTGITQGELSLPVDVAGVGEAAESVGAALLLCDPLMSRLSTTLDAHKDGEVRTALEPLVHMLDATGMSAVGIIHHNKSGGSDPLTSIMGSRAFAAVARAVHTVVKDPDDETGRRRVFGLVKSNLGRDDLPMMPFTIVEHVLPVGSTAVVTSRVEWLGETDGTIADLMERGAEKGSDRGIVAECATWLSDYLSATGGQADRKSIVAAARGQGFSDDQIKRASRRLGVRISSTSTFPRTSVWSLPEAHTGQ